MAAHKVAITESSQAQVMSIGDKMDSPQILSGDWNQPGYGWRRQAEKWEPDRGQESLVTWSLIN